MNVSTPTNLLERAIASVSPQWALKREAARRALRSYDAAGTSRRTAGSWRRLSGSAVTETGSALETLRSRARDLRRNNPYANKAIRINTARTIGPGIVPQATDGSRRVRDRADRLWRQHAVEGTSIDPEGRTNVYGIWRRALDAIQESGEVLIRRVVAPRSMGLAVPLQLQVLEADHLDLSRTSLTADDGGNFVVQGVEFDASGRRVAYHLFPRHPNTAGLNMALRSPAQRLSAGELIHAGRWERIGQVRYVPWAAPAMLRLKDLDEMEDAEVVRLKVAACFAGFIHDTGPNAETPFGPLPTNPTAADGSASSPAEDLARIKPGGLVALPGGKTISFARPEGIVGYEDVTRVTLRGIAAALGPTYELLTGDLARVNFSSIRTGEIAYREEVTTWREDFVIPQLCSRTWSWFCDLAVDSGAINRRPAGVLWTPPRREMLEPVKEIRGIVSGVRAGLWTLGEAIRANGFDPEQVLQTLSEEADLLEQLGLNLTTDPRMPGPLQGGEAPAAAPGDGSGGDGAADSET